MLHHVYINDTFLPPYDSLLQKHDTKYSKKDHLQYEGTRLSTFATFPFICGVYAIKLAGAGFYYAGKDDEVVCFSCNMSYKNWKPYDSPTEIHKRCSPSCYFIQNKSSKIIQRAENTGRSYGSQINATKLDKTLTSVSQTNVLSVNSNTRGSNRQSILEINSHDVSIDTKASLELKPLGIYYLDKPKYPRYAIRSTRLDSFKHWPTHLTQSPDEMLSAGFFYSGNEDYCRCFFCGGGLRSWEPGDQPSRNCGAERLIDDVQTNNDMHTERVKKNVDPYSERQSNDFMNIPAVKTVKEFGYDEKLIKEAYNTLQSRKSDITRTALLETIFILEEDMTETILEKRVNKQKADQELELSNRFLIEENQNLKDHQTCKICLDEPIAIVFLPCTHLSACVSCAPNLRRCPICRTKIKRRVKAIIC